MILGDLVPVPFGTKLKKEMRGDMITDDLHTYKSKLVLAVFGEAENCSYDEKYLIARVGWNRFVRPELFNNIDKDFLGYLRPLKITNALSRQAFLDSYKAVERALSDVNDSLYGDLYFFNLEGNLPASRYHIYRVDIKDIDLKHTFFGIDFSKVKNE